MVIASILRLIIIAGILGLWIDAKAQSLYKLETKTEVDARNILHYLPDSTGYSSESDAWEAVIETLRTLRTHGFLTASIDSFYRQDSRFVARLFIGQQFVISHISLDSLQSLVPLRIARDFTQSFGRSWSGDEFNLLTERILQSQANIGYPFARVYLDEIEVKSDSLYGRLILKRGPLILFDSIDLRGGLEISRQFLSQYLGIRASEPYDHSKVVGSEQKLRQLGYARTNSPPAVRFFEDKAVLRLDLDNQRNSRFDFLIGVLPDNRSTGQNLHIALNLTAEMQNKIGLGESIYARIQRLRPENQELQLAFNYPYFLQLPFGVDAQLQIYRNSSQYIDVNFDLGWQYLFSGRNQLKAFWNISSSRLIEVDENALLSTRELPDQLDVSYTAGGASFYLENLDYRFNPLRGYSIGFESRAGNRKVIRNSEIESIRNEFVNFQDSYDSLKLNSFQVRFKGHLTRFIPLGSRSTLMGKVAGGMLIAKEKIYENEMFRIGGARFLRGFDEESVLNEMYLISTVEYRLILNQNSFISAFSDFGWVRNELADDIWDRLWGFGAGMSFDTRAGIFGISTAVGRTSKSPFDFRSAKVHFSYVSLF